MSSAWTGPGAPRRFAAAALILLASIAIFVVMLRRDATRSGGASTSQSEAYPLLEIRPASQPAAFAAATLSRAKTIAHVVGVQPYISVTVVDQAGARVDVLGVDVTVPLRIPASRPARAPRLEVGRTFGPNDAQRAVAIIGQEYAKVGKTIYGYQIAGMVNHEPPIRLGDMELRVIGTFVTGDRAVEQHVLVPLAIAERLSGAPGQASGLYMQVDALTNIEAVEHDLKAALGHDITITPIVPSSTSRLWRSSGYVRT